MAQHQMNSSDGQDGQTPGFTLRGRFQAAGKIPTLLARRRCERDERRAARPLRSALPFLSSSFVTGVVAILLAFYTPCYALTVGGVNLGYVQNPQSYETVARQVAGQVAGILGQDVSAELTPNLAPVLAAKQEVLSPARLSDQIYEIIPAVTQAYVLTVDDRDVAASTSKEDLDAALEELQALYTDEDTLDVSFFNAVRISRKYIPSDSPLLQHEDLLAALTRTELMETNYVIQDGDTAESVAEVYAMPVESLQLLNPDVDLSALKVGKTLTVTKQTPVLSVCTKKNVSYKKVVPSPVEQRPDDTKFTDEVVTIKTGTPGQAQVESVLTLVDGEIWSEEILHSETLLEATETIEVVGTQERPTYVSSSNGSFIWPTEGAISSPFGYREIFGSVSFHSGLDLSNKLGTSILAADAGTVTFTGPKGSYGNLIIVDHGNGFETYYAHCSVIMATVGEEVSQGELIGQTGSTGRATGNHLHFEVRADGEPMDPLYYLPD